MEKRKIQIGERLSRIRENAGLSQEKLAEMIGCSVITISRWENGHSAMRAMDIINVAECLHVSADYILCIRSEERDIPGMLLGLDEKEREIVRDTINTMINAMKLYQN